MELLTATPCRRWATPANLILQPVVLGYLVLGVVMGLAVGCLPGAGRDRRPLAAVAVHVRHGARFSAWR